MSKVLYLFSTAISKLLTLLTSKLVYPKLSDVNWTNILFFVRFYLELLLESNIRIVDFTSRILDFRI